MEMEEEKHIGALMPLTIALVGTKLIPKKEDLQGAGLSDTKCPSRTIMVNEWTLVTLPIQSRVSSRKSHKLPKARAQEKISSPLWRPALWATSSPASIPLAENIVTGAQPNHCHIYITDKCSCQLYQRALKS